MSSLKLRQSLLCIGLLFLSGCGAASVPSSCPPPRWADEKVAEELENVPYDGYEDFWQFMSDIETLNRQLEVCRK
jgi:hypothetical protein